MKIEVGEYVRNEKGYIFKILNKSNTLEVGWFAFRENPKVWYETDISNIMNLSSKITKHSKNIIDLIETGDLCIMDEDIVYMYDEGFINAVNEDIECGHKLISILTRQQLENKAFKVEE